MFTQKTRHFFFLCLTAIFLASCADNKLPTATLSGTIENQSIPPKIAPDQATFAFDQFMGIPGFMGDELAGYVAERAAFNHIKLVRRMGAPSSYRIKGHLTSTGSKANTTVFYVFDIYDNNGKRVHRIEGLEPAGGTATGDPWAGVSSDSLKRIATRSMASLRAWLHSS